jgi:hypothetical protein
MNKQFGGDPMRQFIALMIAASLLLVSGCGNKKPAAVKTVEDAALEKARKVENFASDRLKVE